MQKVEINWVDGVEIHCPFCGAKVWHAEGTKTCPHVLFHASDYGFEFVREDLSLEEDYEENEDELNIDEFTDTLKIPNAVKFALYQPAPSFFGGYIGFLLRGR